MTLYKKLILFALCCFTFSTTISAQIKAVTERGDTIFVYSNGTWSFTDEEPVASENEYSFLDMMLDIDTIGTPFEVSKSAKKEAVNHFNMFKIKYDEKQWKRIPPGELNAEAEMAFKSKKNDIYCLVISEEIEIGNENVLKIAMNNMVEKTGSTVDIIKIEQRTVNGIEVLRGIYKVDLSGLRLIFDSYFYSNENGTVQFTTWTGENQWEKNKVDIETFLNGLVKMD